MLSFSTQKTTNQYNYIEEEFVTVMTIKMLQKISVSEDRNKVCFEKVMARIQNIKQDFDKVLIIINDDTGVANVQFLISKQIDNENYQKLIKGKIQNEYFLFLFRCRLYRLMPYLDIVNVQEIKQSAQIYFHQLNILQQNIKKIIKKEKEKSLQALYIRLAYNFRNKQIKKQNNNLEHKIILKPTIKEKLGQFAIRTIRTKNFTIYVNLDRK